MENNDFIQKKCVLLAEILKPLIVYGGQAKLAEDLKCSASKLSLAVSGKRQNAASAILMEQAIKHLKEVK